MKSKSLSSVFKSLIATFQKYSVTVFIVVLTSGLAIAVLMLNSTLQKASDTTGYTPTLDPSTFDQVTIDRVKQLHTSDENPKTSTPPTGRTNPFAE